MFDVPKFQVIIAPTIITDEINSLQTSKVYAKMVTLKQHNSQ